MISQNKKIILFGSSSVATATETLSQLANADIDIASTQFRRICVAVNVKTLGGGTTPALALSIQEKFNDNAGADVYIETAKITGVSATGTYWITPESTGRTGDLGNNPAMGRGGSKQIVVTKTGSPSSVAADV